MQEFPDKPKPLAELLGISVPYAYALLKEGDGSRPWTVPLAIRAYRKTGCKIGPIADATDEQIDVLERFSSQAA